MSSIVTSPPKMEASQALRDKIQRLQHCLGLNRLYKPDSDENNKQLRTVDVIVSAKAWNLKEDKFKKLAQNHSFISIDTSIEIPIQTKTEDEPSSDRVERDVNQDDLNSLFGPNAPNDSASLNAISIGFPAGEIFMIKADVFEEMKIIPDCILSLLKDQKIAKMVESVDIQTARLNNFFSKFIPGFQLMDCGFCNVVDLINPIRHWLPANDKFDRRPDLSIGSLAIAIGLDDFNPLSKAKHEELYGKDAASIFRRFVTGSNPSDILAVWVPKKFLLTQQRHLLYKITVLNHITLWCTIKRLLLQPTVLQDYIVRSSASLIKELSTNSIPISDYESGLLVKIGFESLRNLPLTDTKTVDKHIEYYCQVQPFSEGYVLNSVTGENFDNNQVPENIRVGFQEYDAAQDYSLSYDHPDSQPGFSHVQVLAQTDQLIPSKLEQMNRLINSMWAFRPSQLHPVFRNSVDFRVQPSTHSLPKFPTEHEDTEMPEDVLAFPPVHITDTLKPGSIQNNVVINDVALGHPPDSNDLKTERESSHMELDAGDLGTSEVDRLLDFDEVLETESEQVQDVPEVIEEITLPPSDQNRSRSAQRRPPSSRKRPASASASRVHALMKRSFLQTDGIDIDNYQLSDVNPPSEILQFTAADLSFAILHTRELTRQIQAPPPKLQRLDDLEAENVELKAEIERLRAIEAQANSQEKLLELYKAKNLKLRKMIDNVINDPTNTADPVELAPHTTASSIIPPKPKTVSTISSSTAISGSSQSEPPLSSSRRAYLRDKPDYKPKLPSPSDVIRLKHYKIRGAQLSIAEYCSQTTKIYPAELQAYRLGHSEGGQALANSFDNVTAFNPRLPCCMTCGIEGHIQEDCELRRDYVFCLYCGSNRHNTVVCGLMHAICVRCGSRGHRRCRKDTRNEERESMRMYFEKFASLGALTSLRFTLPQWGFLPYPVTAYKSYTTNTHHMVKHTYSELSSVPIADMEKLLLTDLFPDQSERQKVYNRYALPTFMKHRCEPTCSHPEWMNPKFYPRLQQDDGFSPDLRNHPSRRSSEHSTDRTTAPRSTANHTATFTDSVTGRTLSQTSTGRKIVYAVTDSNTAISRDSSHNTRHDDRLTHSGSRPSERGRGFHHGNQGRHGRGDFHRGSRGSSSKYRGYSGRGR